MVEYVLCQARTEEYVASWRTRSRLELPKLGTRHRVARDAGVPNHPPLIGHLFDVRTSRALDDGWRARAHPDQEAGHRTRSAPTAIGRRRRSNKMSTFTGPAMSSVRLATGVTLPYVEQGDPTGVPVVLLHGITDSWRSYEPVLPYLPDSIHAFAPTQRGHGDSDRPATGYRFEDF